MAAEKGRDMVLKIGDGATVETFTTVGGMRVTGIAINNQMVNVSDKDSAGWRELLAQAGEKTRSVTGSGVFKDTASEATVITAANDDTIDNWEIVFADGDKFGGAFQVTNLTYQGENNGARTYDITLESAGAITYTTT